MVSGFFPLINFSIHFSGLYLENNVAYWYSFQDRVKHSVGPLSFFLFTVERKCAVLVLRIIYRKLSFFCLKLAAVGGERVIVYVSATAGLGTGRYFYDD